MGVPIKITNRRLSLPLKSSSNEMMQAKISSFFKSQCDPPSPEISGQIDGEAETFGRNDHADVLVTYKRRDPKPNELTRYQNDNHMLDNLYLLGK